MSAFKKLRSTDSFISVYNAHKNRTFNSSSFGEYGITVEAAVRDTGSLLPADSDYNEALNYRSINHLYYNDFNDESGILVSGSLEHYLDTSLFSPYTVGVLSGYSLHAPASSSLSNPRFSNL